MRALEYQPSPMRWALCKVAGFVSRRAFYGGMSSLRLVERPVPELPGPDWVRLRTILGGVCGTDLALIMQRLHPATVLQRFSSFPAILGHENVATIERIGSDVSDWRPGQRVCVDPALGCHWRDDAAPCRFCADGRTSLCESAGANGMPPRALLGLNGLTGGSWASHFVAHRSQLHAVPDGVSDEAAVLTDPIASAVHAVLRRHPRAGESVLVNGSGLIALGVVAAIRGLLLDNRITIVARHAFQGELASRLGATEVIRHPRGRSAGQRYDDIADRVGGRRIPARFGNQILVGGFDVTYDCTGTGAGLTDALKWTRSRGAVVAVGTSGITLLDTTPLWFDEIEIIGANGRQIESVDGRRVHTYDLVFEWIRSRRIDLSVIPVARFPLAEYRSVFRQLTARSRYPIVKAAFEPSP
ncbi:MAG: alcohol dehydrogenase catalytic domain-containing protein [Planctomycetota bacterium]|nr:alcohol dehydrogenase catalytic domain-containing protein [Planctomycetota bacterium]